jgi:hypothetical protein
MAKKNAAFITVSSEWIKYCGLGPLLKGSWATGKGDAIIQATDHNLSDHSFVEVEFYPAFNTENWIRLYIPRPQIVSIIVFERGKDVSAMGFKKFNPTTTS